MTDQLNTLGFLSWGLLGSAEGKIIYVLDMPVEVEMGGLNAEIELIDLEVVAEITELIMTVDLEPMEASP